MTAMSEEVSFPRGRSTSSKPALRKVKDKLFKKYKKPKKKPFKNSFFEENQIKGKFKKSLSKRDDDLGPSHLIRPLTYQSLEEGMVVVGRIREIHPYHMFICLPGKLSAKVPITAISEPYSNSLTRLQKLEITQKDCPPLHELFSVGQAVVCSIVEVKKEGNLLAVNASLNPALVNKERSHHFIRAGHTLVAAVKTVEDHGYTLYTGIGGLTTFLKFGNAAKYLERSSQGRPLVVGELVRCVVTKCTTARSASRAEVTLDPRVMAEAVITDGNTQTLNPGAAVSCVLQQSSKAGLVVNIGRCKAYVEAAQLPSCWSSPKYIQPGEELTATVIYSLPNSDFQITARPTYLTLKNLNQPTTPRLAVGEVIEAKVTASGRKGLILCLGEKKDKELGNKGFVSIRRLGEDIPKENIAKRFPKGTVVTTKILGFDFMEEIYNCTLERYKLEQQYVSVAQAKAGDRVSCRVVAVEKAGLRLALGPVNMYVFKEHSADHPYKDLQQHFAPGDIVDARVLKVNPGNHQVYVTLKETLIRTPALVSYEAAARGECYWGTVSKVSRRNRLDITFYNDVVGELDLREPRAFMKYRKGQLVKSFIRKVIPEERKLTLSLSKPKKGTKKTHLPVGELYQLVVSNINEDYLEVSPCDFDGIEAYIPKCHLHDSSSIAEGDFLKAWLYDKNNKKHFFSPNPAIKYFFMNRANVKARYRMTCCVTSVEKEEVSILTSIPEIPVVKVAKKEWPEDEQPCMHQFVRLYVAEYDPESKTLKLTYKKPPKQTKNKTNAGDQNLQSLKNGEKVNQNEMLEESDSGNLVEEVQNDNAENTTSEKPSKVKVKKNKMKNESDSRNVAEEVQDDVSGIVTSEKPSKVKRKKSEIMDGIASQHLAEEPQVDLTEKSSKLNKNSEKSFAENFTVTEQKSPRERLKDNECANDSKTEGKSSKRKSLSTNDIETRELSEEGESDLSTSDFDSDESSDETPQKKIRKHPECTENEVGEVSKVKKRKSLEGDTTQGNISGKKQKKGRNSLDDSDTVEGPKIEISKSTHPIKPTLSESGFLWDIKPEDLSKPDDAEDDNDEEEEDTTKEKKKKKTAAERRQAAKEEESRLRQVEQTLLDSERNPQSADQFDRAVLARPDDDELWIKYMSHHLQATEIEKARAVARRALQTINQRLEVERLNIWIALLNLENLFGSQESLKNTLDEALRANDEFSVYTKMLNIYSQSNKAQEAEQLVHTMLRKFRDSLECWVACCSVLMTCGLADKARNLLQRAISALPTKQHVNLLCRFALLENQHGNSEQAQTLFEHILTTYPKRTDVWNVYVDMLVKSEKVNVARQILERATKQKLPPRKMKMLFNKWISFEEKNGTPEKVEYVRKQALAYVNNITNKLDS